MTTRLSDIFDLDLFQQMQDEGYVNVQTHPTEPLFIANYGHKAQTDRVWNDVTIACRGLIYNDQGEIVARGFPKFFNWDDSGQPYPPTGPMVLSTKFDGSLGILYRRPSDGSLAVATRGSFTSSQAIHATDRLYELIREWDGENSNLNLLLRHNLNYRRTPVFEIIYPENRIVVDYKNEDRLVLLDVIDNETGVSDLTAFDNLFWLDKAEKIIVHGGFSVDLTHTIPTGEEGFVLYWPGSGFRCKMKSAEYVELHRVVTGLSEKTVWQMLGNGKTVEDIKAGIPDELYAFVDAVASSLNEKMFTLIDQVYQDYDAAVYRLGPGNKSLMPMRPDPSNQAYRAAFARIAAENPTTRAYLFMVLDNKPSEDLWSAVWKTIKPSGDTRAWNRSEDEE